MTSNLADLVHLIPVSSRFTVCGIPVEFISGGRIADEVCQRCQERTVLDSPPEMSAAGNRIKICSVPTCTRAVGARGLCHMHYARRNRTGTTESDSAAPRVKVSWDGLTCIYPNCSEKIYSRGLCRTHYRSWKAKI
jgi:hypothetical protein